MRYASLPTTRGVLSAVVDRYLRIQIEDLAHYDAALQYIQAMNFIEAERNLQRYGRTLVCNLPDEVRRAASRVGRPCV